jgi:peptidyl-prolyl cis-trans isomerase SurA
MISYVVARPFIVWALLAGFAAPALAQAPAPAPAPAPATAGQPQAAGAQPPAKAASNANSEKILAVVNGDIITTADVINRGRLFALSTGLPMTPEVLERLRSQVAKQLIDERLRLQEAQRRKIAVTDREIAEAITEIEQRNGMPAGRLSASLKGQGVALRTLIDQVRVQIGWSRVIKQELGAKTDISDTDIADQDRMFKAQIGKPEYRVGEIFIPIDDPAKAGEAQKFSETVIGQLRAGAPFGVVAAQFSQSQTALRGGDVGWVTSNELDPAIASAVTQMPVGAISNPTRVPGGISIVTLRAKRDIGRERSTVLNVRQVFYPFQGTVNPAAPTEQQKRALEQAQATARTAKSCADMDEANVRAGAVRAADPGEVRLEGVGSPGLRALLAGLPIGQASRAVVSPEGAAVIMVCSREEKVASAPSKEETTNRLVNERVELASRQLLRDLRRRAVIDERGI